MNRKTTPTTVKTNRKKTSIATGWSGVGTSLSGMVMIRENLLVQFLAARKSGVELVPVSHLVLAEPPAEVDLLAVAQVAEIDQAGVVVFQFDAELFQLLLV